MLGEEVAHGRADLAGVGLQGKMAGVNEAHLRVRDVPLKASAPGGMKKGSFLPQMASTGGRLSRR